MSKVMVSRNFFDGVAILLNDLREGREPNEATLAICKILQREVDAKREAMERRQIFTEYKTACKGSADREAKRQEYLNRAGINEDWRSENERSF